MMPNPGSIELRSRYLGGAILALLLLPLALLVSFAMINRTERWWHQQQVFLQTDQPMYCFLIPSCRGSSDHPSMVGRDSPFGRMVVESDVRRGPLRWYVYGLIREPEWTFLMGGLARYGVEVVAVGCAIGERDYERNMAYNRVVWKHLPRGAKQFITTAQSVRRGK